MESIAAHRFDNSKRRRTDAHPNQRYLTPPYVLDPIRGLMGGIELDPCTEPDNPTGAAKFYTPPQDGCVLPWDAQRIFVNPPYGEARTRWVNRCVAESQAGKHIVLLIPSHTETAPFHAALEHCSCVLMVKSRLSFGVVRKNGRQEAASHGSAIFGFNLDLSSLHCLGAVLRRADLPGMLQSVTQSVSYE